MPQAQVSVKRKRHGGHDSVTVTIAEGFRSASYDLFMHRERRSARNMSDARHWLETVLSSPPRFIVGSLCQFRPG